MVLTRNYYSVSIENADIQFILQYKNKLSVNLQLLPNWEYTLDRPLHTHSYTEITYFFGTGKVLTETGTKNLENGTVTIMPAGRKHAFALDAGDFSMKSIGVLISRNHQINAVKNDMYSMLSEILGRDDLITLNIPSLRDDFSYIEKLHDDCGPIDDGFAIVSLLRILYTILDKLISLLREKGVEIEALKKTGDTPINNSLLVRNRLNDMLNHFYTTDITPVSLSKELYITPKQINRYISQQYGQTFMQRRTELRIGSAQKLLKNSDLTIAEISARVGYTSINTFYSAFKKLCGTTPDKYRNEC